MSASRGFSQRAPGGEESSGNRTPGTARAAADHAASSVFSQQPLLPRCSPLSVSQATHLAGTLLESVGRASSRRPAAAAAEFALEHTLNLESSYIGGLLVAPVAGNGTLTLEMSA